MEDENGSDSGRANGKGGRGEGATRGRVPRSNPVRGGRIQRYRFDDSCPSKGGLAQDDSVDFDEVGDLGNAEDDAQFAPKDSFSEHHAGAPTPWAATRRREALAWNRLEALFMRDRSEEQGPPSSAADWEWGQLWDDMVRAESESRKKGWEPDGGDPASPDSNPEIGEWERQWPSDEPASSRPADAGTSGQPSAILIAITKVKRWIWGRKS